MTQPPTKIVCATGPPSRASQRVDLSVPCVRSPTAVMWRVSRCAAARRHASFGRCAVHSLVAVSVPESDASLVAGLEAAPPAAWERLWAAADVVAAESSHGDWLGGTTTDGVM